MHKFKFHDVEQNEDEWYSLRSGKPTSSKLSCIMANYGKAFGEPAKKYAVNVALECITGKPVSSSLSGEHIDRGHEEEPIAVMAYEEETFSTVTNGGFFDWGDFGCSPDGLVGDDGVIEVKSHLPAIHYNIVRKQSFEPTYKWQFIGNMKFTDRQWLDTISYCGEFPEGKKLYIYRVYAKDFTEEYKQIDLRLKEFSALVDKCKEDIESKSYINF